MESLYVLAESQTLMALQRLDEAVKDMKQAISLTHPTAALQPLFWLTLAKVYTVKKDFRKMHQTIREGLLLFPDYTDFVYWEGMVYMDERNWDRAEECFQKALRMGVPKTYLQSELGVATFKPLWQLARVSRMRNQVKLAEAYYLKTIQAKPAFYPAWAEYLGLMSNFSVAAVAEHLMLVMTKNELIQQLKMMVARSVAEDTLLEFLELTGSSMNVQK